MLYPTDRGGWPGVIYADDDRDGTAESLTLIDARGRDATFTDADGDGHFDSLSFTTGWREPDVTLYDNNLDGAYDEKLGPGMTLSVKIDGRWHDTELANGNRYIRLREQRLMINRQDGIWTVSQQKPLVE